LNKAKRQTTLFLERRSDALTGPLNAPPDINRIPLFIRLLNISPSYARPFSSSARFQ
jgi:hypothetical protein